jgi:Mg-chelatase subunit ChlD
MAKKKLITKVVSCLVVIVIVMSTVPGTVFASEPIPTRIHLQDATFEWNTTQSLVAKLVDEKNVPLSEKEIWFYVGTPDGLNKLGSSITNESGTAKYDIVVTMPDGEYLFNATFNGDINIYAPSSDTAVIAVVGDIAIADDVVIGLLIIGYLATLAIPLVVEIYKQQKWHAREDTQILEQDLNVWESRAVSAPIGGYSEDYYDAQDKINDYQVREVTSAMSTYSKAVDIMTRDSIDVMLDQYKQDAELGKKLRYEGEKLYSLGKTEEERKRGAQIYVVGTKLSLEVSKKTKELLEVKESSKVCGGPYITDFHIDVTPGKAWYSPSETTKVIIDVINDRNQKTNIWLGVSFKDPNGESAKYDPQITITPQSADIDQDTMKTFKAEWTIPADAPIGPYEVAVNCWKDNTFADKYTDDLGWQPIFYCPDFHIVVIPEETWYQPDETSKIKIDVTNNRNQKTNIWLGVSFKDPNGESAKYDPQITITPQSVELNPSETKTFTVEWTPVDAPIGPYEVAVNCWKDNTFTDKYIDDFRWKLIFHCYKLDIVSPTTASPTIVGDPTNPVGFPAKVSTGLRFLNVPGVFSAKIGNKPAKITVAKDDGKGNYVLQITPPIQDTEGSYDLNISVNARKISDYDIEPNAVVYSTGGNIDVVDVIDRSGSMEGEKIQAAKDSAKLFVDLMRVNDLIGVVSHDKTATVNYGLTTITSNSVKQNAKNAIDAISAGGGTSIGSGLRAAYNELVNKGNPTHQRAIVLLSDGKHKSPPHPEDVLPDIRKANIRVFTIGLGADANASLLSHIAHDSGGGEYYYSPGSEELRAIYNAIAGVIKAESTVKTVSGSIQKGETITQKVDIDSTINIATFTLTWASGTLNLELERPNGLKVSPSDFDLLSHTKGTTYETYTISDPIDGEWIMRFTAPIISSSNIGTAKGNLTVFKTLSSMNETNVTGDNSFTVIATPSEVDDNISREITVLSFDTSNVKAAQAGISYTGTVTATTNLAVHMYTDKSKYSLNEPIKIIITLTKAGSPIIGADVNAVIERPDNVKESLWLYDDGKHDDGVALDGVYANYYTNTDVSGSYTLTAFASGTANTEDFTRETKKSVYVSGVSAGDISVTPLSWDIGTIRPGEDVISAFTVSSTSTKDETVMVSATDLTDGWQCYSIR